MKLNNMFAIIDPTSENSVLLHRLARIANRADSTQDINITAYCCTYNNSPSSDREVQKQVELKRIELWLDNIFADIRDKGITVTYQLEWNADWRGCDSQGRPRPQTVI